MAEAVPVHAREIDDAVEAVFTRSGPFGLGWSREVELRRGDRRLATLAPGRETGFFRQELGRIDFNGRVFTLTMPPDRTFGEAVAESFTRFKRRRVWRAGSGIATEIRDITQADSMLRGAFTRDGVRYTVERPTKALALTKAEDDGRLLAGRREVARIEDSLVDRTRMVITPSAPVRLDVLAIALDLFLSLVVPRGGGAGGGGGGGGGDGGGGC